MVFSVSVGVGLQYQWFVRLGHALQSYALQMIAVLGFD